MIGTDCASDNRNDIFTILLLRPSGICFSAGDKRISVLAWVLHPWRQHVRSLSLSLRSMDTPKFGQHRTQSLFDVSSTKVPSYIRGISIHVDFR